MAKDKAESIRLNTDTAFLKVVALVFMAIDHVGAALYPSVSMLRVLGRIAFPIYAYCLTVGITHTHNALRYMLRLALLALISQPIYAVALHHTNGAMATLAQGPMTLQTALQWYVQSWNHPSVLLSLLFGVIVLWSLRDQKYIVTFVMAALLLNFWPHLDYGYKGIVLMALFYLFRDRPLTSFVWVAGFMFWWGLDSGSKWHLLNLSFGTQGFMMLSLPLLYIPVNTGWKIPKWLFYLGYPGHLALLYLIQLFR